MAVIEVRGLTKRFGQVLAVDQLSFGVERGTVTGFLGSNGAGKTTTLRMLLGLVRPDAGTATINGRPYRDLADFAARTRPPAPPAGGSAGSRSGCGSASAWPPRCSPIRSC